MSSPRIRPETVRAIAHDIGFDLVRFGPADPGEHGARFVDWIEQGRHAEMDYLVRNRERILDPTKWREGVRSSISVAVDYGGPPGELQGGGRVARYATNRDYHRWLKGRVLKLRDRLEQEGLPRGSMNGGSDALPVLERALAVRARRWREVVDALALLARVKLLRRPFRPRDLYPLPEASEPAGSH